MVKERVMSASVSRPVTQPQRFGRLWWLPSGGISNGIDDDAWAPILEVSVGDVRPLLAALAEAGVSAYAARQQATGTSYQLWVGSSGHGRAEETLIKVLSQRASG
jgi:hypothetical protein